MKILEHNPRTELVNLILDREQAILRTIDRQVKNTPVKGGQQKVFRQKWTNMLYSNCLVWSSLRNMMTDYILGTINNEPIHDWRLSSMTHSYTSLYKGLGRTHELIVKDPYYNKIKTNKRYTK